MRLALRRTADAVLASATTVVLGVLCLTLSLIPTTRGLGIACAVGIVVAAVFALVALPGHPGALRALGVLAQGAPARLRVPGRGDSLWRRVGDAVSRRPAVFVVSTCSCSGSSRSASPA